MVCRVTLQSSSVYDTYILARAFVQVAVLAKKLARERVSVTVEAGSLTVRVLDEGGAQEYELSTRLYSDVVVEDSSWDLFSTKVRSNLTPHPTSRVKRTHQVPAQPWEPAVDSSPRCSVLSM